MTSSPIRRFALSFAVFVAVVMCFAWRSQAVVVRAQGTLVPEPVYQQIKAFTLTGGSTDVTNLVLKRDRAVITFTGSVSFARPIDGHVTGAVLIGQGTVHADVPPSQGDFEKGNVQRMLGADVLESDFKTAVIRMTDDTYDVITRDWKAREGVADPAVRVAADFEARLTRETGINLSSRIATSIMNAETPGVFFAEFDGGKRGRFDFALDPQSRLITAGFGINGGEKGIFFAYQASTFGTEVWMAFRAEQDYASGKPIVYSNVNDLVNVTHYDMNIDVRDPSSRLGLAARMDMEVRASNVRAIPFRIGEELGTYEDTRLKKQMHLKAVRLAGQPIPAVQEDWEGGFTVFLPKAMQAGEKLSVDVELEGNYFQTHPLIPECFYLISNDVWYPRHADLGRATFDLTFRHAKRHIVASGGLRISEEPDPAQKDSMMTKYRMDQPVPLLDFAVGHFERAKEMVAWDQGDTPIPIEFNSLSDNIVAAATRRGGVAADFMLAELNNAVRYFAEFFGKYPYSSFAATLHPYPFGQGFPTMLFLYVGADSGNANTYKFLSHETAHQWWGGVVAWRSYRDQWLSEGFAEYSGMRYAGYSVEAHEKDKVKGAQERTKAVAEFLRVARQSLLDSPRTMTGVGKGRLDDIGPIILGHRLATSKSADAYQALIYNKGALVLRMLNFLMANPSNGDEKAFVTLMSSFVDKYRGGSASTEEFQAVASENFARTPIASKFGLTNLDWFFNQWVYQTGLPSYNADYDIQDQPDGTAVVTGTVQQLNVPANWVMPLPIVFTLANNQVARTTILAKGASNPFQMKLPSKPIKVELDPASWILSEKTTIKGK